MAEDPKRKDQQDLQSAREGAIDLWEIELNTKMGRILRELEIFEDEDCIYIFFRNHIVGEISCTWRKFETKEKYIEKKELEKSKAGSFEKFFHDWLYSDEFSNTWQTYGKWEKGVGRKEVEGLNFVNPKRFFKTIFGDSEDFKLWLVQNFCDFCNLGLNKSYEKELSFRISRGESKGKIKVIRINSDAWNLALLGQSQTIEYKGGVELYAAGDDDERYDYYELSICRLNHYDNYDVTLYVFKNGKLGTSSDHLDEHLCFNDRLKNVIGYYSPGILVEKL